MNEKISNVLYVKVGKVTTTKIENKRSELEKKKKKYPVLKAYLTKTGFKNDEQGDLHLSVCIAPQKLHQLIKQAHLPLDEILGNQAALFHRPLEEFEK